MEQTNWLADMLTTPDPAPSQRTLTAEQESLLSIAEAYTLFINPYAEGWVHMGYAHAIGYHAE